MFKGKITKKSLDELAKVMPVIEEWEMKTMIGGTGSYLPITGNEVTETYIYTWNEFETAVKNKTWNGGCVGSGNNYIPESVIWLEDVVVTGSQGDPKHTGYFHFCPRCSLIGAGGMSKDDGEYFFTLGVMLRCTIMNWLGK